MFGLGGVTSLFSSLTQGQGAGVEASGSSMPATATSGISGATSFSTGGLNITKTDTTPLLIFGGIAALVLIVAMRKK